jgi:hypothetical protein
VNLTALLLIVCAVRHYGWQPAPDEIEAEVWNIVSAGTFGLVAWRVWSRERLPSASWAVAVLMLHELTTVACSAAWLAVGPWTVPKGVGQCSAAVGFDLDKLGAVLLLAAVVRFVAQPVRTDR